MLTIQFNYQMSSTQATVITTTDADPYLKICESFYFISNLVKISHVKNILLEIIFGSR